MNRYEIFGGLAGIYLAHDNYEYSIRYSRVFSWIRLLAEVIADPLRIRQHRQEWPWDGRDKPSFEKSISVV